MKTKLDLMTCQLGQLLLAIGTKLTTTLSEDDDSFVVGGDEYGYPTYSDYERVASLSADSPSSYKNLPIVLGHGETCL